jgi:hypothetical protein
MSYWIDVGIILSCTGLCVVTFQLMNKKNH